MVLQNSSITPIIQKLRCWGWTLAKLIKLCFVHTFRSFKTEMTWSKHSFLIFLNIFYLGKTFSKHNFENFSSKQGFESTFSNIGPQNFVVGVCWDTFKTLAVLKTFLAKSLEFEKPRSQNLFWERNTFEKKVPSTWKLLKYTLSWKSHQDSWWLNQKKKKKWWSPTTSLGEGSDLKRLRFYRLFLGF